MTHKCLALFFFFFLLLSISSIAQSSNRITILVDAFGQNEVLKQDWGFSALVEYEGKRILFDTGNNAEYFAHNTKALKIDLTNLDFVVISHRHGDHTDGLHHLLKVNPKVKIYVPNDEYFGGLTPAVFFKQKEESLPAHMRYFSGQVPSQVPHGSPWKGSNLVLVDSLMELMPGITLVRNIAPGKQFGETPELSLRLDTPKGGVLLVGCSHPGIERILQSVSAKNKRIGLLVGGLHQVNTERAELNRLVSALQKDWQIESVAPGHCSGEPAFALFRQTFNEKYLYAGVGTVLSIP